MQLFGGVRAADWPYTSGETGEGGECGYDLELLPPVVGLAGYNSLPPNDEQAVMKHIAEVGSFFKPSFVTLYFDQNPLI